MMMTFGAKRLNYVESMVNPEDELDLPVAYTQSMTAGLAYASELTRAAIIGLGGGRTAWYYHKSVPDLDFTAAELDPAVVKLTGQYFDVRPEKNFAIAVQDGRVWLSKSDKDFDVILIDAYRGPFVPFHLLTTEFYQLVAKHLRPGGVAVQNVEPTTMLFDSAVATIKSAFQHVVFLQAARATSSSSPITAPRRTRRRCSARRPSARSNITCAIRSPISSIAASRRNGTKRPSRSPTTSHRSSI